MIAPYAKSAFCNGWAEVDAPLTLDTDALRSAITVAESHEATPGILEAVRRNGRKWALWHHLNAKRDDLVQSYHARITVQTAKLAEIAGPHILDIIGAPVEAVSREEAAAIQAAALQVLNSMVSQPAYQEWAALTSEALLEGTADGMASAEIWLASVAGGVLPSFDIEFTSALDRLRNMHGPWLDPSTWMGRQTNGLAYTMGRDLAQAIQDGASRAEMLDIIREISAQGTNVGLILDYAISEASSNGALDLYRAEGVEYINVLVSPDACLECEALEPGNPYQLADDPGLPMHVNCRCSYSPVDPLNIYAPAA